MPSESPNGLLICPVLQHQRKLSALGQKYGFSPRHSNPQNMVTFAKGCIGSTIIKALKYTLCFNTICLHIVGIQRINLIIIPGINCHHLAFSVLALKNQQKFCWVFFWVVGVEITCKKYMTMSQRSFKNVKTFFYIRLWIIMGGEGV